MNERQRRTYRAVSAGLDLLDARGDGIGPELDGIRERLRSACAEIDSLMVTQQGNERRSATASYRRDLESLRREMMELAGVTRRLFRDTPAVSVHLRVPHKRSSVDALFAAGRAMCDALEPHVDYLSSERVRVERIASIRQRCDALSAVRGARQDATPASQAATLRLRQLLSRASADMHAVTAIVRANGEMAATLGQWEIATRVGKRLGRPRGSRPA